MKTLIVEDSEPKAAAMTRAVESAGCSEEDLVIVPDLVAAKRQLQTAEFSLLLLDLQIPRRFGERAQPMGGIDLLRWLHRRTGQPSPSHIIAVTGFELPVDAAAALNMGGVPVVRYSPGSSDWREFITAYTSRVLSQTRSATTDPPVVDAVVLTSVDIEHEHAKRVFNVEGPGEIRLGVAWHFAVVGAGPDARRVVLAQAAQMGMPASSVLASKAIRLWSPKMLVMAGICAGVAGAVELGDLIVPDPCWDYGSGKLGENGLLRPDPRPIELREPMRALIRSATDAAPLARWRDEWVARKPRTVPELHVGPAATGASVVAHLQTVSAVQETSRKLLGIDMESFGFYYACSNSGVAAGPAFAAVKAVVDFADPSKADDFQPYGAYISAMFCRWLIENYNR